MKFFKKSVPITLILLLLLTSCGVNQGAQSYPPQNELDQFLQNRFSLVDVVKSVENQNDISKIYSAGSATSIDQVASLIENGFPPQQKGEPQNDKQVFVYQNHFLIFTKDNEDPANVLIELSNYGFVRDNYSPSFFQGMLAMWILDEVLDVDDWHKKRTRRCADQTQTGECYGGYVSSGGWYKGKGLTTPSVRGSGTRGGGPGTGK